MRLIIAEKPSQARSIAEAIGVKGKNKNGAIHGKDTVVTWCIGHLASLAMPEDYDEKYKFWKAEDLPIVPEVTKLKASDGTKDQWKTVKSLLTSKEFTEVVNATDSGREGELIFDNVYRLSGSKIPVKRLWTASLTNDAIKSAFQKLQPASNFNGLRDAARCRAEADWIIGLNATRLETLTAKSLGKTDGVYPVGRVQTPTLALIVNREKEIQNFKPETFFTLESKFQKGSEGYVGQWFKDEVSRFKTEEEAVAIKDKLLGKPGLITKFDEKEERKKSPDLYDLTTLQREANDKFGFSADQTLSLAQSLYETHKVLSYPRTGSRFLTKGEAAELPAIMQKLKKFQEYSAMIEAKTHVETPTRFVNEAKVEDHHAIIPTGEFSNSLKEDEKKLFDMVVRRTLAAFYPDRIDFVTKLETTVDGETFKTSGRIMREAGWWTVNPASEKSKDAMLPKLSLNDNVDTKDVLVKKGQTTPPERFNESKLLQAMETAGSKLTDKELKEAMKDGGLGTPATRASIIEGLKDRALVTAKGKNLVPTDKGVSLIEQIPDGILKSPEMTAQWEHKLDLMAKGEYSREKFMSEVKELTTSLVIGRKDSIKIAVPESKSIGECPKCKKNMVLKSYQSNHYVQCENPECKLSYSTNAQGEPLGGRCNCGGVVNITKNGSKICVVCNSWQNEAKKSLGDCPKCKAELQHKSYQGRHYALCSNGECKLSYDIKDDGKPVGGFCKSCKGAMKVTKSKDKVCVSCGTWSEKKQTNAKTEGGYLDA